MATDNGFTRYIPVNIERSLLGTIEALVAANPNLPSGFVESFDLNHSLAFASANKSDLIAAVYKGRLASVGCAFMRTTPDCASTRWWGWSSLR